MQLSRQHGMTLMEILVALAVGVLLLGAAATVGLGSLASNRDALANASGQQELQTVSMTMTRDIRRAGYSATEASAADFQQIWLFDGSDTDSDANDCVVFRYDRLPESTGPLVPPGDGTVDSADVRGFRLNGTRIEMLTDGSVTEPTDCDSAGTWTPLTATTVPFAAADGLVISVQTVRLKSDGLRHVDSMTISLKATASNGNALALTQNVLLRNRPVLKAPAP
ncbi:PilW family protein [Chitinibacteraceae bacterium HSL-7]